eukprot:1536755-Lingulodinium_polyedra.AAC.1
MPNAASTWSGARCRKRNALAWTPTCTRNCCPAVVAALSMAGRASARGKTAATSRQWSGPQTWGASASSPRDA